MAGTDYTFMVYADTLQPFGPVSKENMDIVRFTYDYTCWLETGEHLATLLFPSLQLLPPGEAPSHWRQDYPPSEALDVGTADDIYPPRVMSASITGSTPHNVELLIIAGTPGLSYVVSFLVSGSATERRKQVDTIFTIEEPVNTALVGSGDIDPSSATAALAVTGSTALPIGFANWVILNNTGAINNITITMPPTPALGQTVGFIDALGQDGAHPATFVGNASEPMDGDGSSTFVSVTNYEVLQWTWTGSHWHLQSIRFGFLG